MNREVSITKRVKTANGLRYCPVVVNTNGRIKPDTVIVNGQHERHPEGSYYISWYVGKRLMRLSVGKDPTIALNRRQQKEAELNALNNGIEVVFNGGDKTPLAKAITEYLTHRDSLVKVMSNPARIGSPGMSLSPNGSAMVFVQLDQFTSDLLLVEGFH